MQSGAVKSKILIACDEVGKSRDEKLVVRILCALIDGDDDLECFFTGLTLNPFLKESSGRNIKYVPLPLLTFAISLKLVQSFITEPELLKVSSKLARLSGGHARTIETFENIVTSSSMRALPWTDEMKKFQTVVESAVSFLGRRLLSEAEIMLLLRPRTLLADVIDNAVLQSALEEGKLYGTVRDSNYVELFTSPMLLRSSLLDLQAERNNNELLVILNEMLALVGLRDYWTEFRAVDHRQQNDKKIFATFFLRMEMRRRGFQESQLGKGKIEIAGIYPSVSYQQNCKTVRYGLVDTYDVVDLTCQSDFPSTNPVDAVVVKSVKAVVDGTSNTKIVRPTKENQAAYDFFFILKDSSSNKRFVQLIEPTTTISAGGPDSNAYFIKRYLDKLKAAESLAWGEHRCEGHCAHVHFGRRHFFWCRLGDGASECVVLGQEDIDSG